jgi:ATP-dependent DNA ligase
MSRYAIPPIWMPLFQTSSGLFVSKGLEGLVAKRRGSVYESGQRSGAWLKMRVNRGQEFVIGGYTPGPKNFDALIFGYYEGNKLIEQAHICRSHSQRLYTGIAGEAIPALSPAADARVSFANLPEARGGRWGQVLTARRWNTVAG